MLTKWLTAVVLIAIYGLVGLGLITGLMGSAPTEASLATVTGRLEDLAVRRAKSDGAPSFEFEVRPAAQRAVSLHMRAFGVAGIVQRMEAARGQIVTVRYRAGLLGKPAYAIAGPAGSIVSLAQARAYLEADDTAHRVDYQNGLILYGLFPVIIWAMRWWFRRARPVEIPRPSPAAAAATESMRSLRLQRALVLAGLGLVLVILMRDGAAKPDMLKPLIGVFGPNPLGLEPIAAYPLVLAMGLAPLALMVWHLIAALHYARERDGIYRGGKLGMLMALYQHWDVPRIRRHALLALAGLVLFIAAGLAWIVATSKAGV